MGAASSTAGGLQVVLDGHSFQAGSTVKGCVCVKNSAGHDLKDLRVIVSFFQLFISALAPVKSVLCMRATVHRLRGFSFRTQEPRGPPCPVASPHFTNCTFNRHFCVIRTCASHTTPELCPTIVPTESYKCAVQLEGQEEASWTRDRPSDSSDSSGSDSSRRSGPQRISGHSLFLLSLIHISEPTRPY